MINALLVFSWMFTGSSIYLFTAWKLDPEITWHDTALAMLASIFGPLNILWFLIFVPLASNHKKED